MSTAPKEQTPSVPHPSPDPRAELIDRIAPTIWAFDLDEHQGTEPGNYHRLAAEAVLNVLDLPARDARIRAEALREAAAEPGWLVEILHVAWAFARREHEGQMVTLVPEHATTALRAVPAEVLRAAGILNSGPHSCSNCEGVDPASCWATGGTP